MLVIDILIRVMGNHNNSVWRLSTLHRERLSRARHGVGGQWRHWLRLPRYCMYLVGTVGSNDRVGRHILGTTVHLLQ